jgi:predicted O-methyltransferase YrrM
LADLSPEDRARLMHSKTGYLDLYGRLKDLWLPVSRDTGALLYMLARSSNARSIVEFGTSFGISTVYLAAALRDNGGGRLVTSEFELPQTIDLLLLDGAKALYGDILGLVEGRLAPGALIVADNADDSPDYLAHVRAPANGYLSVPFGEDVELSMRLG